MSHVQWILSYLNAFVLIVSLKSSAKCNCSDNRSHYAEMCSVTLIEHSITLIEHSITLIEHSITLIEHSITLIEHSITLI